MPQTPSPCWSLYFFKKQCTLTILKNKIWFTPSSLVKLFVMTNLSYLGAVDGTKCWNLSTKHSNTNTQVRLTLNMFCFVVLPNSDIKCCSTTSSEEKTGIRTSTKLDQYLLSLFRKQLLPKVI